MSVAGVKRRAPHDADGGRDGEGATAGVAHTGLGLGGLVSALRRDHVDGEEGEGGDRMLGPPGAKRGRMEVGGALTVYGGGGGGDGAVIVPPELPAHLAAGRASCLPSPTMLLTGHDAAVLGCDFNASGTRLATCGKDRRVMVWGVGGQVDALATLTGHKNAVTAVKWANHPGGMDEGGWLVTSSADGTCGLWDVEAGVRVRCMYVTARRGGGGGGSAVTAMASGGKVVNDVTPLPASAAVGGGVDVDADGDDWDVPTTLFASASDDGVVRVWDTRARGPVLIVPSKYPVTTVAASRDGTSLYLGGVEGVISQWDVRRGMELMQLSAHADTITSLAVSPDGKSLASFGMDTTLKVWDVRPFTMGGGAVEAPGNAASMGGAEAAASRCLKVLLGASNSFEQALIRCTWSPEGDAVACGSADRFVYVWDVDSGKVKYALPGHTGVVTGVAWHPSQPILASTSQDKNVFLGELATV